MSTESNFLSIARIAREPDGHGYFAHVVELPDGGIVEVADGFRSAGEAIEWAKTRASGAIVRLGFGSDDEYGFGNVPSWTGKLWPPTPAELDEIERRVERTLGMADQTASLALDVEPEIRRARE